MANTVIAFAHFIFYQWRCFFKNKFSVFAYYFLCACAKLQIVKSGRTHMQCIYFDIKVFNPLAATYASSPLAQCMLPSGWGRQENKIWWKNPWGWEADLFSFGFFLLQWNGSYSYSCLQTDCYYDFWEEGSSLTAMCCNDLDVVSVFHYSILLSCVCGDYHRHNLTDPLIDLACSESYLELDRE